MQIRPSRARPGRGDIIILDMEEKRPEDFGIGRLFKHIRDGVIVGNAETERIVLWNDCATSIFGYSEAEALDLHLHALVPPGLRARHRAGLAAYQETGGGELIESGRPAELWGLHRQGHEIPIELTLTAIPERGSRGERFVLALVRDATERRAAEQARLDLEHAHLNRQQALELNDTIVQGLVVAKAALELGRAEQGLSAVSATLERAKAIVSELLADLGRERGLRPGDLVREKAASVKREDDPGPPPS